eukprot:CAMPEP_0113943196 /NCGR_PEP_ID=MMETSP1339-20121228/20322_1 /TAXON_ID=94617 /ORGANISM="Fibrocapsa japonica" /LENGTH=150 /DNA_ID=CAMNT_0000948001 /DNA_START=65 /DNA_END=518 /DNA_ORIENTATION=+ /assembly_acc=CAM_ASM_000762
MATNFNVIRRKTLRLEVDGIWDSLENEEEAQATQVTKKECRTLRSYLGKGSSLMPGACELQQSYLPAYSSFTPDIKGGEVSDGECQRLANGLSSAMKSNDVQMIMPKSCSDKYEVNKVDEVRYKNDGKFEVLMETYRNALIAYFPNMKAA